MNTLWIVALIACSLLKLVLGGEMTINTPTSDLQPGSTVPISWSFDANREGPLQSGVSGLLYVVKVTGPDGGGSDTPVSTVGVVTLSLPTGTINYQVPRNIDGPNYALKFVPNGNPNASRYSGRFNIGNANSSTSGNVCTPASSQTDTATETSASGTSSATTTNTSSGTTASQTSSSAVATSTAASSTTNASLQPTGTSRSSSARTTMNSERPQSTRTFNIPSIPPRPFGSKATVGSSINVPFTVIVTISAILSAIL